MASSSIRIELQGFDALKAALNKFNIPRSFPSLFRSLGEALVTDVKKRIRTQDGGKWKPASKWIVAKKNTTKALQGADEYVTYKATPNGIQLGSDAPGWTLNQHDRGFHNKLFGPGDRREGKAVVIDLMRPSALSLPSYKRDFHFVPSRPGETPARKIWPSPEETDKIVQTVASRWLDLTMKDAGLK